MLRRFLKVVALTSAIAGWQPQTASADLIAVDLELVLTVDVSLSMDAEEQRLQRDGYVEALRDPEVLAAIRANGLGRIGLVYLEWAGCANQKVTVPWALIDGPAAAGAFSDRLAQAPIMRAQRTSISCAMELAGRLFDSSGFRGKRRVIDVSGDGPNNDGGPVTAIRDKLVAQGITINGLPIMLKVATGWFDLENLDRYYEDCVIGGFAAFMVVARDKPGFARAIKRKLLLEIAALPGTQPGPSLVRIQATQELDKPVPDPRDPASRADCLIGEKRWQQYMGGRRGAF